MQFEAAVADDLVKPHGERSTAQVGSAITERVSSQPATGSRRGWAKAFYTSVRPRPSHGRMSFPQASGAYGEQTCRRREAATRR